MGEVKHEVSVTLAGTERTAIEGQIREFVHRAICHALLDGLPVPALEEVAECIADSYTRHVLRPRWLAALPPAPPTPALDGHLGVPKAPQPLRLIDD
jgi:hypothetical protein